MNCDQVRSENIIEQYLLGHLDDADRDAFEEHFFSCSTCHEALQTYRALQSEHREEQPVELTRKADAGAKKWTYTVPPNTTGVDIDIDLGTSDEIEIVTDSPDTVSYPCGIEWSNAFIVEKRN